MPALLGNFTLLYNSKHPLFHYFVLEKAVLK